MPAREPPPRSDFQIGRKEIQIEHKEIKAQHKEIKILCNQILGFPSPNRALSRDYADPQGLFSFLGRFRAQRARRSEAGLVRPGLFVALLSSFRILQFQEASEGLAPFPIADCVFVRRMDAISPSRRLRASRAGTGGNRCVHGANAPGTRGKTGQLIRRPARMRPLKRARSGSSPLTSGRAPALHACEYLTMPPFESYPFGFAHARRERPPQRPDGKRRRTIARMRDQWRRSPR